MDPADVCVTAPLSQHAYLSSAMLLGFHALLTLLEFGGSEATSCIYWHHRFPEVLYPLLTGQEPTRTHTGLWLGRLRKAPFGFQCLAALVANMSPHTFLGTLVIYYAGTEAHLPPPLLVSSLMLYEGLWLILLSGQMAQLVPLQWSQRWVLRSCMDVTPLLVLLLACSCAGAVGNHVGNHVEVLNDAMALVGSDNNMAIVDHRSALRSMRPATA
jgi:hypothetical protein